MRRSRRWTILLTVVALALAAGCSRSKADLVTRARDVSSRADLERALGRPDDISKLGPVETWTYRASDGRVVFVVVGDRVTLQAAGGADGKN